MTKPMTNTYLTQPNIISNIPTTKGFLRWSQVEEVCAVDIDYSSDVHTISSSDVSYLSNPFSVLYWKTLNGFRAITTKTKLDDDIFLYANEIGALLAYCTKRRYKDAIQNIELKSETRSPLDINATIYQSSFSFHDCRNRLFFNRLRDEPQPSEDEIADWLNEHGYPENNKRPGHEFCPIDPSPLTNNDAVHIRDDGIVCYRCAAVLGDGFRSWANLLYNSEVINGTDWLYTMALNQVHWGLARYKIRAEKCDFPYNKTLYSAAMKLVAWPDERRATIAHAIKEEGLILSVNGFLNTDLSNRSDSPSHIYLASLPFCRWPSSGDGSLVSSIKRQDILGGNDRELQRRYGLYPVTPMGYCDLGAEICEDRGIIPAVREGFRYVPKVKRFNHWQLLNDAFPGISQNYVRMIMYGIAHAQALSYADEPPTIICVAPSGSGKTITPELVAALIGGRWSNVNRCQNEEETLRTIGNYSSSTVLLEDEVFKHWTDPIQFVDFRNRVRIGAKYRPLYKREAEFHTLPLMILTDVYMPDSFKQTTQIHRRYAHIELTSKDNNWLETSGGISSWLKLWTPEFRNSFLSEIIDELREMGDKGLYTFLQKCNSLGGLTLAEASKDLMANKDVLMAEMWELWSNLPVHEGGAYSHKTGWRKVEKLNGLMVKLENLLENYSDFRLSDCYNPVGRQRLNQFLKDHASVYDVEVAFAGSGYNQTFVKMKRRG